MDRLPFDPEAVKGPEPQPPPARRERGRFGKLTEADQISVTQACELIRRTLEERVPSPLRVVGEVSNLNRRQHWYFSLKDEGGVLNCVAFASSVRRFRFTPDDGQEIVAAGHISHYAAQGRTQLYVSAIEPVGAGALELKFRALCEELRKLGYFSEERKRPIPVFPRRIALVTSAGGAAVHDVRSTALHRCAGVGLLIVNVRVQGEGAADEVARAIRRVNRHRERLGVDAILVTRGGGSMEDLWAFNERIVADAVFESDLPIVAAIGHESDTTIAELVADLRASTPTQAAMRLVPDRRELLAQIAHFEHRLISLLRRCAERERERLVAHMRAELFRSPHLLIDRKREHESRLANDLSRVLSMRFSHEHGRLARAARAMESIRPRDVSAAHRERAAVLADRLRRAIHQRVTRRDRFEQCIRGLRRATSRLVSDRRRTLEWHGQTLAAISVRSVLKRGFSYTTLPDGEVLKSISQVRAGERLLTHLADGTVASRTEGSEERRRHRSSQSDASQLDLFDASE